MKAIIIFRELKKIVEVNDITENIFNSAFNGAWPVVAANLANGDIVWAISPSELACEINSDHVWSSIKCKCGKKLLVLGNLVITSFDNEKDCLTSLNDIPIEYSKLDYVREHKSILLING